MYYTNNSNCKSFSMHWIKRLKEQKHYLEFCRKDTTLWKTQKKKEDDLGQSQIEKSRSSMIEEIQEMREFERDQGRKLWYSDYWILIFWFLNEKALHQAYILIAMQATFRTI